MMLLPNFQFLLFLPILFNYTFEQTFDAFDYDAYGDRLAMSEYFGVLASNDQKQFTIFYAPYPSSPCITTFSYIYPNQFVYSVAVGSKQNASQLYFTYTAEYLNSATTPATVQVIFGIQRFGLCYSTSGSSTTINLSSDYQRKSVLGIDPYGQVAYVVSPTSNLYYNLDTLSGWLWSLTFPPPWQYSPRSIVVDDTHTCHAAVYECLGDVICHLVFLTMWRDQLSGQMIAYTKQISDGNGLSGSLFSSSARNAKLFLVFNFDLKLLLLGVPYINTIFIYNYSLNSTAVSYTHLSNFTHPQLGIAFGKSVGWLNNDTIAILAYSLPTLPWSTSQIQVYRLDDVLQANGTVPQPYSVYPNNQQVLVGSDGNPLPKVLIMMIPWSSNSLAVLSDVGDVLLAPQSLPGFCASELHPIYPPHKIYVYREETCIPGTSKDNVIWGPCRVCPPMTKNNGSFGLQCQPCSNQSFCPLASTDDILNDSAMSYGSDDHYPESPDLSNFEDILLHRVFSLQSRTRCLVLSPLFWACIVMGLILIVICAMGILQLFPHRDKHRQLMMQLFSRLDLIGEGELWIGGLVSLIIVVVVSFAYAFSRSFVQLYPIETVQPESSSLLSCDPSLLNAKFTTGLQLLSIKKVDNEQTMFDMLDSQSFNLTIQFINTAFNCSHLYMQQNNGDQSSSVAWTSFNCSKDPKNHTLVVSTILSDHEIVMEYDLTGPYFVGGVRVCLTADGFSQDAHTLQQLNVCQFFSTNNQTLSSSPYVTMEITKIINYTISLTTNQKNQYTGRWLPSLTMHPLSDSLLYQQSGDYLRYLNSKTMFIVNIGESKFYVKNTQEPIIKPAEVTFQAILFAILCLELFGLCFVVVKLAIVPLIQLIQRRLLLWKKKNKVDHLPDVQTPDEKNAMFAEAHRLSIISSSNPAPPQTVMTPVDIA